MKIYLIALFVVCSQLAFAQTTKIIRGDAPPSQTGGVDVKALINGIEDKNVYDMDGNILDSVAVTKLMKTYEYYTAFSIPKGHTSLKRVVKKANPAEDAETQRYFKMSKWPKSSKFWDNATLDLSALSKRTDLAKLEGKAVVLLFWKDAPAKNLYGTINEVIADHIGNNKFDFFAITDMPSYEAKKSILKNPILNAHLINDAENIKNFYEVTEPFVLVVTNAQHQITFAITTFAPLTPRILNRLFKAL